MAKNTSTSTRTFVLLDQAFYTTVINIEAGITWKSTLSSAVFDNQYYTNYIKGSLLLGSGDNTIKVGGITVTGSLDFGDGSGMLSADKFELGKSGVIRFGINNDIILCHTLNVYGKIVLGVGGDMIAVDTGFNNTGEIDFGSGMDALYMNYTSPMQNDGSIILGLDAENDNDKILVGSLTLDASKIYGQLPSDLAISNYFINGGTISTGGGSDIISGLANNGTVSMGPGDDIVCFYSHSAQIAGVSPSINPGSGLWDGGAGLDRLRLVDGTYTVIQGRKGLEISGSTFVSFEQISGLSLDPTLEPILDLKAGTFTIGGQGTTIQYLA